MHPDVIERCRHLDGATISDGAFAEGPAVWVGRREVAHVDADGAIDIRLTRQIIRQRRGELELDTRISFRAPASDWLEVRVATDDDADFAATLIADAVAANLPTAPTGNPPTGSELERRRRFH
jgi:hypothetical protein